MSQISQKAKKALFDAFRFSALIFLVSAVSLWYGARTEYRAENHAELNALEKAVMGVVSVGGDIKKLLHDFSLATELGTPPQPPLPNGEVHFAGQGAIPDWPTEMLWLTSVYTAEDEKVKAFALDLGKGDTIHRWELEFSTLERLNDEWKEKNAINYPAFFESNQTATMPRAGFLHPLILPEKRILVRPHHDYPLICLDSASNVLWQTNFLTHHSTEHGADGTVWLCTYDKDSQHPAHFDDEIVQIDQRGNVLFERNLREMFQANPKHDYSRLNPLNFDPYHLNDVEPVLEDSEKGYWKAGDVFLSLKHISVVLLYRPSNDSIVWSRMTPWTYQHDVNLINDSVITVFNNNPNSYEERLGVPSRNQLVAYDFSRDSAYLLFEDVFEKYEIYTPTQGRGKWYPADSIVFIESGDEGRVFVKDLVSGEDWQIVMPGRRPKQIANTRWTRLVDPKYLP